MEKGLTLYMGPEYPKHIEGKINFYWFPIVDIIPINNNSITILEKLNYCDWIVFTSPRGPKILTEDAIKNGIKDKLAKEVKKRKIAAVGIETANSIEKYFGRFPDLVPENYSGKSLAQELVKRESNCILMARSKKGLSEINDILERNGKKFVEVNIYDEVINDKKVLDLENIITKENISYVILSSPLIAEEFCKSVKNLSKLYVIAIGPSTYNAAIRFCNNKILIPEKYTLLSVADLIKKLSK